uniref:RING-type domain-containing protein n=1 Tax=Plectus sambesii TaxID=2011161 RepID=A0A914XIH2_9BILA
MNPGGYRPPQPSGGQLAVESSGWARCDVCNSELPAQFTQLYCLHRFCPSCTGITQEKKACPLCVNRLLPNNLEALHLGAGGGHRAPQLSQAAPPTSSSASSPPFFADLNAPVSDPLTVDTSFLIWDPPKIPPHQLSSSNRSQQQQRHSAVEANRFTSV